MRKIPTQNTGAQCGACAVTVLTVCILGLWDRAGGYMWKDLELLTGKAQDGCKQSIVDVLVGVGRPECQEINTQ